MEKVVIFDWGGVVESHEDNLQELKNAKIKVIRRFNKTLSDEDILNGWTDRTSDDIKVGTVSDENVINEWISLVQKNMNINVSIEEFKRAYEEELASIKYYKDVVEYAHSLKGRCKIAILSNLLPIDKKRIDDQYDLSKFDNIYLSFEIGMSKPDRRVYEYVLNDLGVAAEDILFIDDDINNILMAKEYGWNTCHACGYELEKIKQTVESFLNCGD